MTQHPSRLRSGRDSNGHWISYSDMMCSLLMVFILAVFLCIYQYYKLLETKTAELDAQQIELDNLQLTLAAQKEELDAASVTLLGKEEELSVIQIQLDEQQADLENAKSTLIILQGELDLKEANLTDQENKIISLQSVLDAQELQLSDYQAKISAMLGVRTEIIQTLSDALIANNIKASVDKNTGDIILDSTLMFETNSFDIKAEGKAQLDTLMPVYLSVLMQDEYKGYIAEIMIEGHTDSTGTYENNLALSQDRALSVAMYCLEMNTLSVDQKLLLKEIMTATGHSYSDLIYNDDGTENKDLSRRVEIKFRMKDTEMIEEMNKILSGME